MVETKPKPRFEEKTEGGGIEVVRAHRSSPDTQRTNPGKVFFVYVPSSAPSLLTEIT